MNLAKALEDMPSKSLADFAREYRAKRTMLADTKVCMRLTKRPPIRGLGLNGYSILLVTAAEKSAFRRWHMARHQWMPSCAAGLLLDDMVLLDAAEVRKVRAAIRAGNTVLKKWKRRTLARLRKDPAESPAE